MTITIHNNNHNQNGDYLVVYNLNMWKQDYNNSISKMVITNITVINGANFGIFTDKVLFCILRKTGEGMSMDFLLYNRGCLIK